MKKCPNCSALSDSFVLSGPVIWGTLSVRVDNSGQIVATGPVRASTAIKAGQEVKGKHMKMRCSSCGYEGRVESFRTIVVCALTGVIVDNPVLIELLGWQPIPVDAAVVAIARKVFTAERMSGVQDQSLLFRRRDR